MRNNPTAYTHPTIRSKIKQAALKAYFQARRNGKGVSRQHYVANRKGHNIMRIDYSMESGFIIWGDNCRNITSMILPIIGHCGA